jgi:hypothetical protein
MFLEPGNRAAPKAGHFTIRTYPPVSKRLSGRLLCAMLLSGTFETCRRTLKCLFIGVDRKSSAYPQNDVIDPKRTRHCSSIGCGVSIAVRELTLAKAANHLLLGLCRRRNYAGLASRSPALQPFIATSS